jgi:hypothetical protein
MRGESGLGPNGEIVQVRISTSAFELGRYYEELFRTLPAIKVPRGGIYLFKLQGCLFHFRRRGQSFLEGNPLFNAVLE